MNPSRTSRPHPLPTADIDTADPLTQATLQVMRQIWNRGYIVTFALCAEGNVDLRASNLLDPAEIHIARCLDCAGPDEFYETSVRLAQMLGIRIQPERSAWTRQPPR